MKKLLIVGVLIFTLTICAVNAYDFTWAAQNGSGSRAWYSVASSSDGSKLVAAVAKDYIYTSNDSGITWTPCNDAGSKNWRSVASSSDGSKLVAAVYNGGYIFTSDDFGVNWRKRNSSTSQSWSALASSSDGSKLVAGSAHYLYTSSNSGKDWTERSSAGNLKWDALASSSDGSKLIAGALTAKSHLYTSNDSGVTWVSRTGAGSAKWSAVASSSDGSRLVAAINNGYIYTSNDSGVTWTVRTSAGSRTWSSVTSSSDGVNLAAAVNGGYIYTSNDSGKTWTAQTKAGSRNWYAVSSSANGSRLVAVVNGGYIYTAIESPPCVENWTMHYSACLGGNHAIEYIDLNSCSTRNNLPSDNGTVSHCVASIYTYGSSTNMSTVTDFSSIPSLTVETPVTKIVFDNNIDLSSVSVLEYVLFVSEGLVTVDAGFVPSMNSSASIWFNASAVIGGGACDDFALVYSSGLHFTRNDTVDDGVLVANSSNIGGDCIDPTVCTDVECSDGIVSFTAMHFDSFAVSDLATLNSCVENWSESLSVCDNNQLVVSYTDLNSCGTNIYLPFDNGTLRDCGVVDVSSCDSLAIRGSDVTYNIVGDISIGPSGKCFVVDPSYIYGIDTNHIDNVTILGNGFSIIGSGSDTFLSFDISDDSYSNLISNMTVDNIYLNDVNNVFYDEGLFASVSDSRFTNIHNTDSASMQGFFDLVASSFDRNRVENVSSVINGGGPFFEVGISADDNVLDNIYLNSHGWGIYSRFSNSVLMNSHFESIAYNAINIYEGGNKVINTTFSNCGASSEPMQQSIVLSGVSDICFVNVSNDQDYFDVGYRTFYMASSVINTSCSILNTGWFPVLGNYMADVTLQDGTAYYNVTEGFDNTLKKDTKMSYYYDS